MAFPKPVPGNYTPPVEEKGVVFHPFGGRWRKLNYPQFQTTGGPEYSGILNADNKQQFNIWFRSQQLAVPRNFISLKLAFQVDTAEHMWLAISINNAWNNQVIADASGLVNWGDGGEISYDYGQSSWGNDNMHVEITHDARKHKPHNPQFLDAWFVRIGAGKTMMSWRHHIQCVTDNVLCTNYGKCNINADLNSFYGFNTGVFSAHFIYARMSAEIY